MVSVKTRPLNGSGHVLFLTVRDEEPRTFCIRHTLGRISRDGEESESTHALSSPEGGLTGNMS
jgi:hypothetical protein